MKISILRDAVVAVCFLILLLLVAIKIETDAAVTFTGGYRVVDGDSLALGKERLRLLGIDAPELSQTCMRAGVPWRCGEAARATLAALVDGRDIACTGSRKDKYQRQLVTCTDKGLNLNREMVVRGFAVAFGDYDAEEQAAWAERAGFWAGDFIRPADWRRTHKAGMEEESSHFLSYFQRLFGSQ
jgi:endonuclease YncB( thermonuclease family)